MTLKIRLLAGIPILFALIFAFIWLHFILDTMPAGFYSGDDINFFSPLISEFAATGDLSLLFEPQGPHMHLFYKLQTYLSMNYFGWNPHLTPALGLLLLLGLAWTFSLRKINMTDNFVGKKESFRVYLFWMIANLGFVCVILGHLNQRSFSYHMLSLNNPVLIGLGAVCLYKFAKLLNNPGHWQFVTLGVFSFASLLFIWGLSTAFNYFLLAALAFMAFIIAGPTFVKALINVIFRHQKPYGIVNWLRDYRSAMVGGCLFTFLTLLYYVIVSGAGGNTGLSLSSISPSFILDISYASAGWVFLTGKYAIAAKSIVTLVFALAVSLIIFFTRRISRNDKLFFTGVIVFILFFGLGTVMLRGNNAILLPRYVAVFGLFWIAATWALGRVSIEKLHKIKTTTLHIKTGACYLINTLTWLLLPALG